MPSTFEQDMLDIISQMELSTPSESLPLLPTNITQVPSPNTGISMDMPVGASTPLTKREARTISGNTSNIFGYDDSISEDETTGILDTFMSFVGPGGIGDLSKGKMGLDKQIVDMFARKPGQFLQQTAERADSAQDFSLKLGPGMGSPLVTDVEPIHVRLTNMLGISEQLDRIGQSLVDSANETATREGWNLEDGNPTLMYNLGAGGASLAEAIGLTIVTKNPMAASVLFGGVQQVETYDKARGEGLSISKSTEVANISGLVSAGVEAVGMGALMKSFRVPINNLAGRIAVRATTGFVTEGTQEAVQESSVSFIEGLYGVDEKEAHEIAQEAITSFLLGGMLGSGASVSMGAVQDVRVKNLVENPEFQNMVREELSKDIPQYLQEQIQTEIELSRDSFQDSPATRSAQTLKSAYKDIGGIIKSFNEGIDISEVYRTPAQKDKFVNSVLNDIKAKNIRAEEESIKSQVLSEQKLNIDLNKQSEALLEIGDEDVADPSSIEASIEESFDTVLKVAKDTGNKELEEKVNNSRVLEQITLGKKIREIAKGSPAIAEILKDPDADKKDISLAVDEMLVAIDKIPVSDKAKTRIKNKISAVLRSPDPANRFNSMINAGGLMAQKELKAELKSDIKSILKKKSPKKTSAKNKRGKIQGRTVDESVNISSTLDTMRTADSSTAKAIAMLEELKENGVPSDYTNVAEKYIRSKELPGSTTFIELAQILEDTEAMIEGKDVTWFTNPDSMIVREREKTRIIEEAGSDPISQAEADQSKSVGARGWAAAWMRGRGTGLGTTYFSETMQTVMDLMNFSKDLGFIKNDMAYREMSGKAKRDAGEAMFEAGISPTEFIDKKMADNPNSFKESWEYKNEDLVDYIEYRMSLAERDGKDVGSEAKRIASKAIDSFYDGEEDVQQEIESADSTDQVIDILMATDLSMGKGSISLTPAKAMNRIAVMKNEGQLENGISPFGKERYPLRIVEKMRDSLSQEELGYIDSLMSIVGEGEISQKLMEEYRSINGAELGVEDNYWPSLKQKRESDTSDWALFEVGGFHTPKSPFFTKERTKAFSKFADLDIDDVFKMYVEQASLFVNYKRKVDDINHIINDPKAGRALKKKYGARTVASLQRHIKWYAAKMEGSLSNERIAFMEKIRNNVVKSALIGRGIFTIKQATSTFAMMEDIPVRLWPKYMAKLSTNYFRWAKELREHETFGRRSEHFDTDVTLSEGMSKLGHLGEGVVKSRKNRPRDTSKAFYDSMVKAGMSPVRMGDFLGMTLGGGMYYDYLMNVKGMSKADARQAVAEKAEKTQQTKLPSQLVLAQKEGGTPTKMMTTFGSSVIAMYNGQKQSIIRYRNSDKSKAERDRLIRSMFIYQVLIPFSFTWVSGGFEEPEEAMDELMFSGAKGQLGNVPIVGAPVEIISAVLLEELTDEELLAFGVSDRGNPTVEMAQKVYDILSRITDEEKELEKEDVLEAIDLATGIGAKTANNIFESLSSDMSEEEWMVVFGFTPNQAEKRIHGGKKKTKKFDPRD